MPYKVNSVTGETSEYVFDIGGILALRNFTARTNGERLIIQSATNANFTILDALVSEVEIDGVVYDNPIAAQEALQRLVFNPAVPVIMTLAQQQLLEGALQKGDYNGTAQDLKQAIDNILTILNSPDTTLDDLNEIVAFIKQNKQVLDTLAISNIAGLQEALNEKADTNHTHAFSDLTGTENVASKQDITDAISAKFNGTAKQLMLANGTYSSALLVGGAINSSWTYTQDWCGSTIFVKGQATINLQGLGNHESVAFKKCFDGGQITFTCNGKTIVKRGADEFNGADGSNAVVSVVDNKCYIDINNYE